MYKFALHLIDMNTDREELFPVEVDETPIECTEKDIFLRAMSKAYDITRSNDKYIWIIDAVINTPAADIQPVTHGRWSECYTDSHHYSGICTVCGKASIRSIKENPLEYCPKCGARMDGDDK